MNGEKMNARSIFVGKRKENTRKTRAYISGWIIL
jgi:hypothetical protein